MPPDEAGRLAELERLGVLDTPPEMATDRVTRLAAAVFHTPIALISLIDRNRQWFKSRVGVDVAETPRDQAFCAHAILGRDLMIVPDASQDPRFRENPLVTGDMHLRFYAGAPLITRRGFAIGTLCLLDRVPHPQVSKPHRQLLGDLRDIAVEALDR